MLPRKQIRDALHAHVLGMTTPSRIDKGALNRYQETDLPAINITTYNEEVQVDIELHADQHIEIVDQQLQIGIYAAASLNFEDSIDAIEQEFWQTVSDFEIAGVDFRRTGSNMSDVQNTVVPQGVRIINLIARYEVGNNDPNLIIT